MWQLTRIESRNLNSVRRVRRMEWETDIYLELKAVQAECARLREENARLRKQLGDREPCCLVGAFQTARDEAGVIANPLPSGLHQPFANQPLPISQHCEKAILIRVYPLGKPPVLLERRGVGNVARAHQRIEHSV